MGAEQDELRGWIEKARDAHATSTTYFDANIRANVEKNMRQFQGKHPTGSKYLADTYKNRSKLFRNKTRASIRKDEAACANAYFCSEDVVNVAAVDDDDLVQSCAADVFKALLQYRLTKPAPHGVPWFMTLVGAYQETLNLGVVISKQDWEYNVAKKLDRPRITLKPIENIRFDPASDWTDPIGSSPYVIDMVPMYVGDIKARMTTPQDGQEPWFLLTEGEISSAIKGSSDTIRLTREGRTDSKDSSGAITDFQVGWVHENIVSVNGEDFVYYTLGTQFILSRPVPLAEVYFHDVRPFVLGVCIIEPHKIYPIGKTELVRDVQKELNEVVNERRDNVKRILDPRWKAKRDSQVDVRSLTRNVPSSVTLMTDLKAAEIIETRDVTASSFNEQDRINGDFDELGGNFSTSSITSNRRMNETVGGMDLLSNDADQVGEFQLRAFTETWVEPVLRQLVLLERHYETNETILALAGKSAGIYEQGLQLEHLDYLLDQDVLLTVNVGIGSTNPSKQADRFVKAVTAANQLLGEETAKKLKAEEVIKELFSKAGFKDGLRFYNLEEQAPDPMVKINQDAMLAKIELDKATTKQRDALAVQANITAIYSGAQAAQVISAVPQIAPITDQLLLSGGFQDADSAPVVATPRQQVPGIQAVPQSPAPVVAPEAGQSTDPAAPAVPAGPGVGEDAGIRTPGADGIRA